jgi:hypothetical protein
VRVRHARTPQAHNPLRVPHASSTRTATRLLWPALYLLEQHHSPTTIACGQLPAVDVKLHGGDDVRCESEGGARA